MRVPADVEQLVGRAAECFATTKPTEDVIGRARSDEKGSQSGRFGPGAVWTSIMRSTVLCDADRPHPPTTRTSEALARQHGLPKHTHKPDLLDPAKQLDKCDLDPMVDTKSQHRSPSARNFDLQALQWASMVSVYPDFELLKQAWWSAFAVVGSLLVHRKDRVVGMVVQVSSYGLLLWKLVLEKIAARPYYTCAHERGQQHWSSIVVLDPLDWRTAELQAVTPRTLLAANPTDDSAKTCVLRMRPKKQIL